MPPMQKIPMHFNNTKNKLNSSSINVNAINVATKIIPFRGSMLDRITNARKGCSSCGQ